MPITTHAPLTLAVAAALALGALACTIVAVGKDASSTGHPMVCHTDDSGNETTDVRLVRMPQKRWAKGSVRQLYTWSSGYPRVVASELSPDYAPVNGQNLSVHIGAIPQVPETYAYWDMAYGVLNEWGLAIGESTCGARTIGFPATPDRPWGYCRAGIEDLTKIALERCKTARCAVETMGSVAVEMGFYSTYAGEPTNPGYEHGAEALAVADGEELWVFHVMAGKNNASAIWAAQRMPPNHVVAIGNSFTIRKMNLSDPENFRCSPNVTQLAEEMGWWSPKDDESGIFDFCRTYGYVPEEKHESDKLSLYSGRRMWRIFNLLSPVEGAKLDPNKGNLPTTENPYPGSVPAPRGSVTPRVLMDLLRDHFEGTPYDLTVGMAAGPFGNPNRGPLAPPGVNGLWERAISLHRTSWSQVLEASPNGRGIFWLGYDAPHGTAYLPFFAAAGEPAPESFCSHEGYMAKFNTKTAWWAFNLINQYTDINFQLINSEVRNRSKIVEDEGHERVKECFARAERVKDEEMAKKDLARCGNEFALDKVAAWWDFAWTLFAKYGRYTITSNESARGMGRQMYPAWWLESPEVGFTLWKASGPGGRVLDRSHCGRQLRRLVAVPDQPASLPAVVTWRALIAGVLIGTMGFQLGARRGGHLAARSANVCTVYPYLAA